MIYLGRVKAGTTVKYRANFHDDTGTLADPAMPEAQLEKPDASFTALTTPVKINGKTGQFGGSIDTTGFATGQHFIRMAGTVATGKVVATEFCFEIEALAGIHTVTVQVYETSSIVPIADVSVDVWNSTETTRLNGSAMKTDALGQLNFQRDDGTYKIRLMKAGVTFVVGTVVVNGANVSVTLYGTTIAHAAPSAPGLQVLYGNVRRLNWAVSTGETITLKITENKQVVGGALVQTQSLSAVVDANSQFEFANIPCGAGVVLTVPNHGDHKFTLNNTNGAVDVATYL